MAETDPQRDESPAERVDRELIELLNELRIVLPGVTVLLAFLVAVPFAKGWPKVDSFQRDVFLVAFLATGVSVAFRTAPSSYHRLRFRAGQKERLVIAGGRLTIAGIAAFAVALEAVVLLVVSYVLSTGVAIVTTVCFALVIWTLWYGPVREGARALASRRGRRSRSKRSGAGDRSRPSRAPRSRPRRPYRS